MKRSTGPACIVLVSGFLGCFASALAVQPISIFATGVNNNGIVIPDSTVDAHWQVTLSDDFLYPGPNTYTALSGVYPIGPWMANTSTSKWIKVRSDGSTEVDPGTYVYTQTFDLTGFDPATAQLSGQFSSDDWVDHIELNGVNKGQGATGFSSWHSFSITSGFTAGLNTLSFYVVNVGTSANPHGFRAEVFGTAEVIVPPAAAINPAPTAGAVGASTDADLSWTAGAGATWHTVYFGQSNPPAFIRTQTGTTFDPGVLAYDTTYYWRIDEGNAYGTTTGAVWSFTTRSFGIAHPAVAHWTMDDNEDTTTVFDSGVSGRHGVFVDPANPNTSYHHSADAAEGTGALLFDGNDHVEISGWQGILGQASRTCTAWIKTSGSAQAGCIVYWGTPYVNGQSWVFRVGLTGELSAGTNGGLIKTTATLHDGQWHHVAAVLDNDGSPTVDEIRLYIDGQLQDATASSSQAIDTVAAQDVVIGAFKLSETSATNYFVGSLDDVRIYDYALSSDEIYLIQAWSPVPGDLNAFVSSDLRWPAGVSALSYDVFLGTSKTEVASAQRLLGDINGDGPAELTDLSMLAAQWLTHPGDVNHSADIALSGTVDLEDFAALAADWNLTADLAFQGNQTGTTFDPGLLGGSTTYYWRIDEVTGSGTTPGTVWSFTTKPAEPGAAFNPFPMNGAANLWIHKVLSWAVGPGATSHNVYFGTDATPDAGEFKGNRTGATYDPGTLVYGTTYYWRIDEVNDQGTTTGPVWSFTVSSPRMAPEDFAIQVWTDLSNPYLFDAETFEGIYECGFNLAGFVGPATLDMVAANGLKAHIRSNDFWAVPNHGLWLPKSEKDAIAAYYADLVGDHPGLFGYFLQDEPSTDTFSGIAEWVDAFHTADPDKQTYVNLGWDYNWDSYISIVQNDFLSYDFYGMLADGSVHPVFYAALEKVYAASAGSGLPFWNTVCSMKLDETAYPSPANLRLQAFISLAYGARGISWFHYSPFEPDWQTPITSDGSKRDIWYMLQNVNLHLHRIGPVYLTLNNVNVFHYPNANVPSGTTWMPYPSKGISSSHHVSSLSGGDFCVGEFYDPSGHPYIMLVNKSLTNTSNFNGSFKTAGTVYRVNSDTGQLETLEAGERYLAPGEGMLLTVQ